MFQFALCKEELIRVFEFACVEVPHVNRARCHSAGTRFFSATVYYHYYILLCTLQLKINICDAQIIIILIYELNFLLSSFAVKCTVQCALHKEILIAHR